MNVELNGSAATPNASRYLQQLCKHWGHRFTADFTPEKGNVDFGDGTSVDLIADAAALRFIVHAPAETHAMMREVVEEHLNRFAHREGELTYQWQETD